VIIIYERLKEVAGLRIKGDKGIFGKCGKPHLLGIIVLTSFISGCIFTSKETALKSDIKSRKMKTFYRISSQELGTVMLRRRKIAKALRWWLRENGFDYKYVFFVS